jgi:restriction system protein
LGAYDSKILDVRGSSLDEWLKLLREPPADKIFIRNMFPTEAHRTEWLQTAHFRSEEDVKLLLRHFLVSTGSNLQDRHDVEFLVCRLSVENGCDQLREHDRRLLLYARSEGGYPVWEGLGWIIDLLPEHPRMALNVMDAFFQAYYDRLTDNYLSGLFDAQAVVRSRYIESFHTKDPATRVLLGLDWRELEWLCGAAFDHMGFQVVVTPRSNDDGADVFATSQILGQRSRVVIQARKWQDSNPVGKGEVRELLGTVDLHRATKGVLITTGRYESGALEMAKVDPRIELIGREEILALLNEHCGADWFTRVDRLISSVKRSKSPSM